jgi:hypothetical protein
MTTIQKYFLCALAFNAISLSAMENVNELVVHKVNNKIDLHHLGVGKYDCCRSIRSAIASYWTANVLSAEKSATEIKKIQSYIPAHLPDDAKKRIFSELTKKHYYVYYLMQKLEQHKFEQFKNVKGSTIDTLYQPDFTHDINGLEEQIYTDAKKRFCASLNIDSYRFGSYRPSCCYYEDRDKLFLLYLCHAAFENSRSEKKERETLKNSETMKLIQIQDK